MTDPVPAEAITAAFDAVTGGWDIPAPGTMKRILGAAAPHIAAAERERIRQLAIETAGQGAKPGLARIALRAFADRLKDQP